MADVVKAIIPAGGLGTRFLPFTKAVPKELLPILNKPAIQYIVEEGLASDISQFFVITSKGKSAIEDHFDPNVELELLLKERNQLDLISSLERIARAAQFCYIRQSEPLGLGHAIWSARHTIGKEYFGVFLPDDIIISKVPAMLQLLKIARQEKASVIAVQEVPIEQVSSYGVISIKKQLTPNLFQVSHVVEKPDQKESPSNLAIVGRYVLSNKIFASLEQIEADKKGELQLTDAISHMMHNNEKVFAFKIQGMRYDVGNPIGWIKAIIGCALQDPQCAPHITKLLEDRDLIESFTLNRSKIVEHSL
ncbi:MAG: UTP--glucose-1-phosphate uridylyltransferase [Candidatus Dependentiae bacterium ADurb.Bin331]|nr:MAG: UTP--glucose-1-phosphate uridylyltransferase [Candidatus Dependentiae bacterium ADurb.Bin331]